MTNYEIELNSLKIDNQLKLKLLDTSIDAALDFMHNRDFSSSTSTSTTALLMDYETSHNAAITQVLSKHLINPNNYAWEVVDTGLGNYVIRFPTEDDMLLFLLYNE